MHINWKRIVGESIIGSWKSYQVGLGENIFLQGKNNFTLLMFLKDGALFSEVKTGNDRQLGCFNCKWEIHESEGRSYIVVDGIPFYEISSIKKDRLILKGFSGITVFFMPEEKWNALDFPVYKVHAQA